MRLDKILLIGGGVFVAYQLMNKKTLVEEPAGLPAWDNFELFDWAAYESMFEDATDNGGQWITNSYQDAREWLTDTWDRVTE